MFNGKQNFYADINEREAEVVKIIASLNAKCLGKI